MGEREMTMVERVARTAATFDGRPFEGLGRADRSRYLERARLEIEAMRELTDEMIINGLDGLVCKIGEQEHRAPKPSDAESTEAYRYIRIGLRMQDGEGVKACWQGAISAALSEIPATPAKEP